MTRKHWPGIAAATLALGLGASSPGAAPLAVSAGDHRAAAAESSLAARTASRRCWWQDGQRYCRRTGEARPKANNANNSAESDYYVQDAKELPFGSQRWWEQMVRENRGGNSGGGGRD